MKIKVPDVYKPLYLTDKPIILLTGGRGSAKSFNAATFAKRLTYEQHHKILYTRYTMDSASKSIIPEFKEKIELENDGCYFNVNNTDILNKLTESMILFSGIKTSSGNQTAKLKSIQGLSTLVVDEAEEWVNGDEYETIKLSIRNKKVRNRVIIIMNPSFKTHWVFENYIKGTDKYIEVEGIQIPISNHPDVEHIHTTYNDNIDNLSREFLLDVEDIRTNNIEKYNQKILGQWRNASEGQILKRWKYGEFDNTLPFVFAIDWGWTDPFTLTKIAVDEKKKKVYIDELCYQSELSMTQIKKVVSAHCRQEDIIVCDNAEPMNIKELRDLDYNAIACIKGPGSIQTGLRWLQDYLLVVTTRSANAEIELSNYIWAEKKSETPIDKHNHLIDGVRYGYTWIRTNILQL